MEDVFNFDEQADNQVCVCTSSKVEAKLTITKMSLASRQFIFVTNQGRIPKELSGGYSTIDKAKQAYIKHYSQQRPTVAAKAKQNRDRRTEKYASKLISKEC